MKIKPLWVLNAILGFVLGSSLAVSVIFLPSQFLKIPHIYRVLYTLILIVFFCSSAGFVLSRSITPKFLIFSFKVRLFLLIGSVGLGTWFFFAVPLRFVALPRWEGLIFVCNVIALSSIFFAVGVWVFARPFKYVEQTRVSGWEWLLYALPMFFVWSLYLLAFWPGSLSFDSIYQWGQMLSFKFTDWHPAFHTLTNWLITRVWLSPAAIAFTQIVAMSLVLGWGLAEQRRLGAPRWLPWMVTLVIVLIPSNGLMVIALWKDVFYSISVIVFTILVFKITLSYGEWFQRHPVAWVYLGCTAALVGLFRQNGPVVAFGTMLCLTIVYERIWRRFLLAFFIALALWLGVRGPVYDLVGVDKSSTMSRVPGLGMAFAHLIARYTTTNTFFSLNERALLQEIRPEQIWPYECQLETNLFFTKLNWANLKERTYDLGLLSIKLIYRNPEVFVDHIVCNSSFIYQITQPPNSLFEPMELGVYPNKFGIIRESKLSGFKHVVEKWVDQKDPSYNWIFWRVPFWGYLFVGSVILYSVRSKNGGLLIILLPVIFNMLPLTFMTVLQSFRYVYSTLIISVLMCGYFIFLNIQTGSVNIQNSKL